MLTAGLTSSTPATAKDTPMDVPHIDITNKGIDPTMAAFLSSQGGGLGGNNGIMPLLLLALLGGRGGLFGGLGGYGAGPAVAGAMGAAAGMAEAQAIASITSAKDAVAATNAAKDTLGANIDGLSKQLCCSTADITAAINTITPQMFQSFATLTQGMTQGFASVGMAMCQNQAATISAINATETTLSTQAAANAAAAALANCQTQNLIQASTCDIKQHITADGAATRALIQSTETARIQSELTDAKLALSNANQTAAILAALRGDCHQGNGGPR